MTRPTFEAQWAEIKREFDWKTVQRVFATMNWTWHCIGIPQVLDLQLTAEQLLREAYDEPGESCAFSTGRLSARRNGMMLKLSFEPISWNSEVES